MRASGPVDNFQIPRKGPPIRLLTSKHLPMGPSGEICSGKKRGEKETHAVFTIQSKVKISVNGFYHISIVFHVILSMLGVQFMF